MIYIYNDFGGTHTTALAAAYHLKELQRDKPLQTEDILNVRYFNKLNITDMGRIIFHGIDENGDSVYTLGRKNSKLVVPSLEHLSILLQEKFNSDEKIIFSNTSPTVPFAMTIGGLFSRRLKIDPIGVPLLVAGAKQAFGDIMRLVDHTKEKALSTREKVLVLENKHIQ